MSFQLWIWILRMKLSTIPVMLLFLGEVRTPYFFVLLKKPTGMQVAYSRQGGIEDPEAFLELVCARTGIGKGK